MNTTTLFPRIAIGALIAFAAMVVPYGWNHTNPPVRLEPAWNATETRALTQPSLFRLR